MNNNYTEKKFLEVSKLLIEHYFNSNITHKIGSTEHIKLIANINDTSAIYKILDKYIYEVTYDPNNEEININEYKFNSYIDKKCKIITDKKNLLIPNSTNPTLKVNNVENITKEKDPEKKSEEHICKCKGKLSLTKNDIVDAIIEAYRYIVSNEISEEIVDKKLTERFRKMGILPAQAPTTPDTNNIDNDIELNSFYYKI